MIKVNASERFKTSNDLIDANLLSVLFLSPLASHNLTKYYVFIEIKSRVLKSSGFFALLLETKIAAKGGLKTKLTKASELELVLKQKNLFTELIQVSLEKFLKCGQHSTVLKCSSLRYHCE